MEVSLYYGSLWRGNIRAFYVIFLMVMGLPIMVCEYSMGRASRRNLAGAMLTLEPAGTKWHIYGYVGVLGNLILMMFYTTVSGWGMAYIYYSATGRLSGLTPQEVGAFFNSFISNVPEVTIWMALTVVLGFMVCSIGLQAGVERASKVLMSGLFLLLIVLIVRSVTLPGAEKGLAFYLKPDFSKLNWEAVYAAMSQAFFSLSLGIGSMTIFGSYLSKDRALMGESIYVIFFGALSALMSGLVGFLVFVLFCTLKRGWGWHNFIREANIGIGPKFPETLRGFMTHVLPFAILFIFVMGYYQFFRVG